MIHSDWHIHSESSYDGFDSIDFIYEKAKKQGLRRFGITDHVNFNNKKFLGDLYDSADKLKKAKEKYPIIVPGVELTPLEKPEFLYIKKHGTREGYVEPESSKPYDIELQVTKEELVALGIRYAVGAVHWRVDIPTDKSIKVNADPNGNIKITDGPLDECIGEWHRQQMFLACDERVTILGHPWYSPGGWWYEDFSVIPSSMHRELCAALKENGKYVECNSHFFRANTTEKFRHQYVEFLREMFEAGIPITYGSDSHQNYPDMREMVWSYLEKAGFSNGDVGEIDEKDLW